MRPRAAITASPEASTLVQVSVLQRPVDLGVNDIQDRAAWRRMSLRSFSGPQKPPASGRVNDTCASSFAGVAILMSPGITVCVHYYGVNLKIVRRSAPWPPLLVVLHYWSPTRTLQ